MPTHTRPVSVLPFTLVSFHQAGLEQGVFFFTSPDWSPGMRPTTVLSCPPQPLSRGGFLLQPTPVWALLGHSPTPSHGSSAGPLPRQPHPILCLSEYHVWAGNAPRSPTRISSCPPTPSPGGHKQLNVPETSTGPFLAPLPNGALLGLPHLRTWLSETRAHPAPGQRSHGPYLQPPPPPLTTPHLLPPRRLQGSPEGFSCSTLASHPVSHTAEGASSRTGTQSYYLPA